MPTLSSIKSFRRLLSRLCPKIHSDKHEIQPNPKSKPLSSQETWKKSFNQEQLKCNVPMLGYTCDILSQEQFKIYEIKAVLLLAAGLPLFLEWTLRVYLTRTSHVPSASHPPCFMKTDRRFESRPSSSSLRCGFSPFQGLYCNLLSLKTPSLCLRSRFVATKRMKEKKKKPCLLLGPQDSDIERTACVHTSMCT